MSRALFGLLSTFIVIAVSVGNVGAGDITTKKILIKDNADPAKTKMQLQSSKDPGVAYADAVSPDTQGASIHVYSATNDLCVILPSGADWSDNGKAWKYKSKATKNQVKLQDGKLQIKVSPGADFPLTTTPQATVQATVQLGDAGERFCMTCSDATKDTEKLYLAKNCSPAPCEGESGGCLPGVTTTTTTTTSTTTTTLGGFVVGAIQTSGRFNLMMTLGLPGAEAACDASFTGSHVCKYSELLASQGPTMTGLRDTSSAPVTSFWAVDPVVAEAGQCGQNASPGATRWIYNTGHIGVGGDSVTLDNGTGTLGSLVPGGGANRNCGVSKWIGCCQ